jgi:hypothetical protein
MLHIITVCRSIRDIHAQEITFSLLAGYSENSLVCSELPSM